MLPIDRRHHGDHGSEQQKRAVAFVGFDDHVFAAAEARGRTDMIHAASHDERGIESRGGQDARGHRGRGGLAVRAGDGDPVFQAHQFREHFGARDDRNLVAMRLGHFGIVAAHGGRNDHDVGAVNLLRFVALKNFSAHILVGAR